MSGEKSEKMRETFVTIAQLSMDSIHSETKTNSRIKGIHDDNDLHLLFPIHHTVRTLLIQFKIALKKAGYKCIDMCQKQLLVIRLTFFDRFRKLFMCKQPPKFILTVTTHQFLSVRTVSIKPLRSNSNFSFRESRPLELQNQIQRMGVLLQSLASLNQAQSGDINELDSQYKQDFYSLDATSYYMFSRMLVDGNYSLGQKMHDLIEQFNEETKVESLSKQDLLWLSEALNEISDDLLQGFNCSRKQLLEILAYCRKSVEQYFHNNHQQRNANQGKENYYDSEGFPIQKKELLAILPDTMKQLLKLQRSTTSMDILKNIFLIGLIYKAECEIKSIDEQIRNKCIFLIRTCFSSVINEKTKLLKSSGYTQEDYEEYINKFNFDHEVTF